MTLGRGWSRYATAIGVIAIAMISLTFLVPWYGVDFSRNGVFSHRAEYSLGVGVEYSLWPEQMGDVMSKVTMIVALSLVLSVIAAALSCLGRRVVGVIAGASSAVLMFMAGVLFYFWTMNAFPLDSFCGYTLVNRTISVEAAPMLAWWLATTVPTVQGAQAVVLAYSSHSESRKRP